MNGSARFTFPVLLIIILTGCTTPIQFLPIPTATLRSPTATQGPTQPPFENTLVYDTPEMYKVIVETVQYPTINGTTETLPMDVFYPSDRQPTELLPAVIMVNGFPNNVKYNSRTYGVCQSWGRVIASYGLIAVGYDTRNANDLEAVIKFIQKEGADLGIDGSKLGFFAISSNGGLASSFAFQEDREYLKFAVFYYAWILTPDNFNRDYENAVCMSIRCLGAELPDAKRLRNDLPVLAVRCGQDDPDTNAGIDNFARLATEAGVPLTLIKFDEGNQFFDWSSTSTGEVKDKAIGVIQQTLEFMKTHASE
jgi:hypothetical protein